MCMSKKIIHINTASHYRKWDLFPDLILVVMPDHIMAYCDNKIRNADSHFFQENVKLSFEFAHGVIEGDTVQSINDIRTAGKPCCKFCNKTSLGFMSVDHINLFFAYHAIIKYQSFEIMQWMDLIDQVLADNYFDPRVISKRVFFHFSSA